MTLGRTGTLGTILIFGMGETIQTNSTILKMLTETLLGQIGTI